MTPIRRLTPILIVLIATLAFPGCGDDDPAGTEANEFDNQVAFAYVGGGTPAFGADYAICCGEWLRDGGTSDAPIPAFKVLVYDAEGEDGGWKIFLSRDEITAGTTYQLPAVSAGQDPDLLIFAVDPDSGNELASNAQGATGSITVNELDCGPPVRVSITFTNVVLPSEFHDAPAVQVSGTIEAEIHENPTDIGCDFGI